MPRIFSLDRCYGTMKISSEFGSVNSIFAYLEAWISEREKRIFLHTFPMRENKSLPTYNAAKKRAKKTLEKWVFWDRRRVRTRTVLNLEQRSLVSWSWTLVTSFTLDFWHCVSLEKPPRYKKHVLRSSRRRQFTQKREISNWIFSQRESCWELILKLTCPGMWCGCSL